MSEKWKKKPSLAPRLIAAGAVLLLVWMFLRRPASNASLVDHFHRNRSAFIELKAMLATNSPATPTGGTETIWSTEHYKRYRELLHRTRVIRVLQDGPDVRFQLVGPLEPGKGDRIAVTWTETKPDNVVGRLSEFRKTTGQPDHAYQSLGEDWYLWAGR